MLVDELDYQTIGTLDNTDDAFKIIKEDKPALILMLIQIKGELTGIKIVEKIQL